MIPIANIITNNNLNKTISNSQRLTKEERQRRDRLAPKCKCGNNLSVDRVKKNINHCPACDYRYEPDYKELWNNLKESNLVVNSYYDDTNVPLTDIMKEKEKMK